MAEGGTRPVTILNVDDYQPGLYSRSRILRQAGYAVYEAATGLEALRLVAAEKPDLVLLDVNLPDVDGVEVCRRIKADPETASVPVLHISATSVRDRDRIRGLEFGADNYLVEPIDPDELIANVEALLRTRRAEQAARAAAADAERRRHEAEVLSALARSMTASLDPETVLAEVAAAARDLCRADAAHVAVRDPLADGVRLRYFVGPAERPPPAGLVGLLVEPGKGLGGRVLLTGRPARTDRYAEDPAIGPDYLPHARALGVVAALAVPVLHGGRVEGLLYVLNLGPRPFTGRDEDALARLAEHAAIALRNSQLFAREQAARAEAEAANRAKDQFLATLSHELRTPLTALVGWVRLLRDGRLDDAMRARALESIDRNARAQVELVDELLDVSRIVTGQLRLALQPADAAPIVAAAADAVRPAAEAAGLVLETAIDPEAGVVAADPHRLQQVLANLLGNAVKFTPAGGRVVVELRREGEQVAFTVRDTGCGIDPAFLPHVFDPFRQADMTTTKPHGGLGLGLAIVRHLVELHGGAVRAESEGIGRGATLTVLLPAAPPGTPPPPAAGGAAGRIDGVHVLLVEDDADGRELLAVMLADAGARVTAVGSVRAALEALDHAVPGVLVSDIAMPDADGYELLARVRSRPAARGGAVPAIALTALADRESEAQCLAAGFQAHVGKPVHPERLLRTIAAVLAGREAPDPGA